MSDIQVGTRPRWNMWSRRQTPHSGRWEVATSRCSPPHAPIAWAEAATCAAVADRLDVGETTVGSAIGVEHRAPTQVGDVVVATAVVAEFERGPGSVRCHVGQSDGETALTGNGDPGGGRPLFASG